jgi:hemolysin III
MLHRREQLIDLAVQAAGLLASVVGVAALITRTISLADGIAIAAALTYGLTLVAMFACSILNTTVQHPSWGPLCRLLDHAFIYFLIAGTYTPFCLLAIGGPRGIDLLIGVWLAAIIGVAIRILYHHRFQGAVITLYLLVGWSGLIHLDVILHRVASTALALLALGGVLYSAGAPIHRWARLPYHSAIWHGCVVLAAACHYGAILLIVMALHGPAAMWDIG